MDKVIEDSLLSVVIPCYNDYSYVRSAVNSALNQTYAPLGIIIVDDGSLGKTKAVLKDLESDKIRIIFQDNQGTSAARNTGIEEAKGEYILVLDSDDFFEPEFAEKAIAVFKKNRDVKLVSCYANWFNNKNKKVFKPGGGEIKDVLLNNVAMGSSMFRQQDWNFAGGYDEKMLQGYEDWEFYIRLLSTGGSAFVIPEILFNYRNKQGSRNKKADLVKYDLFEYIYIKHAKLYKQHFSIFVHEWLKSNKKSEAFKQQVVNSLDYKIGHKILKPFRAMGLFKKTRN